MQLVVATIAVLLVASALGFVAPHDSHDAHRAMWQHFKQRFNKVYASKSEEVRRFNVFLENMKMAEKLQASNPLATFGMSPYADRTPEEFKVYHNAEAHYKAVGAQRDLSAEVSFSEKEKNEVAGRTIDWRQRGAVTAIKNQADCGSCWSFSATGSIEGQWFLAGHPLVSCSEQELVSCDTTDDGCQGGLMNNAFKWLVANTNGFIATEASYPYVSGSGSVPACNMTGKVLVAQINGHVDITKNEADMTTWVYANGPLSIAVDATSWQTYSGGILTNCISNQVDHGVLIVGFDDAYTTPYWIVKNSWGLSWGESGYIRVAKGSNQCLITYDPTSSTVAGGTPSPSSPTSTPSPSSPPAATFEQKHCTDPNCDSCTVVTLSQGVCIPSGSWGYVAYCLTDALAVETFANPQCTGASNWTSEPINVCEIEFHSNGAESFIMNVCPGSGPTPPSPPTPPAPTPAPSGTFSQLVCSDVNCTQNCQSNSFQQNVCLQLTGGGSAIANCSATALNLAVYPVTTDCTGMEVNQQQPLDSCQEDSSGSYFETLCSTGAKPSGHPHPHGVSKFPSYPLHHSRGLADDIHRTLSQRLA